MLRKKVLTAQYWSSLLHTLHTGVNMFNTGHFSNITTRTCGVPQGSVLGPILFLLYTSDITKISLKHELLHHLYADDSKIYGFCQQSAVHNAHLRKTLLECIGEVASWMLEFAP
jgi:hypothetical protein